MSTTMDSVSRTKSKSREILALQGIRNPILNDEEVVRFLIANAFDVDRSADSLSRRIKFTSKHDDEAMLGKDLSAMEELLPLYWALPNQTHHVLFAPISAKFDSMKFAKLVGGDGRVFVEWLGEKLASRLGPAGGVFVVVDLAEATLGQTMTPEFEKMMRFAVTHLQSMHPERLKKVFFLNAPSTFSVMMFTLKRLLNTKTMLKFETVDSIQGLSTIIPLDLIPLSLGGLAKTRQKSDSMYFIQTVIVPEPSRSLIAAVTTLPGGPTTENKSLDELRCMLADSLDRLDDCETMHLDMNARLRRRIQATKRDDDQALTEGEFKLRERLVETMDERDAYRRAVEFARNFIEQEAQMRVQYKKDIEQQIAGKKKENLALVGALQSSFGQDAPKLFR